MALEFSDVPSDYWATKEINEITNKKVISGFEDDTFRPEIYVKREDFDSMMIEALNQEQLTVDAEVEFSDVNKKQACYDDVNKLCSLEVVESYPDKTFKPTKNIRKYEAMVAISKTIEDQYISTGEVDSILSQFVDQKDVAKWSREKVGKSVKNELFIKYPEHTALLANNFATRAEVAYLLSKAMNTLALMAIYKNVDVPIVQVSDLKPAVEIKQEPPKDELLDIEHIEYTHSTGSD